MNKLMELWVEFLNQKAQEADKELVEEFDNVFE